MGILTTADSTSIIEDTNLKIKDNPTLEAQLDDTFRLYTQWLEYNLRNNPPGFSYVQKMCAEDGITPSDPLDPHGVQAFVEHLPQYQNHESFCVSGAFVSYLVGESYRAGHNDFNLCFPKTEPLLDHVGSFLHGGEGQLRISINAHARTAAHMVFSCDITLDVEVEEPLHSFDVIYGSTVRSKSYALLKTIKAKSIKEDDMYYHILKNGVHRQVYPK